MINRIKLLSTGRLFVGEGIRSIDSQLEIIIKNSESRIDIAMFAFGVNSVKILDMFEKALERGVQIRIIIDGTAKQPKAVMTRLNTLQSAYPHLRVSLFKGKNEVLHAKIICVDGKTAIIGSANLTWSAMMRNHELSVLVEGPVVRDVSRLLSRLEQYSTPIGNDP